MWPPFIRPDAKYLLLSFWPIHHLSGDISPCPNDRWMGHCIQLWTAWTDLARGLYDWPDEGVIRLPWPGGYTMTWRGGYMTDLARGLYDWPGEGVVGLCEGPAGPKGGWGRLLQQFYAQSPQPLNPVILADSPRCNPCLQQPQSTPTTTVHTYNHSSHIQPQSTQKTTIPHQQWQSTPTTTVHTYNHSSHIQPQSTQKTTIPHQKRQSTPTTTSPYLQQPQSTHTTQLRYMQQPHSTPTTTVHTYNNHSTLTMSPHVQQSQSISTTTTVHTYYTSPHLQPVHTNNDSPHLQLQAPPRTSQQLTVHAYNYSCNTFMYTQRHRDTETHRQTHVHVFTQTPTQTKSCSTLEWRMTELSHRSPPESRWTDWVDPYTLQ